jgi:cold shock CspA family protein/ribosome-associated translation inhibitor RaiA
MQTPPEIVFEGLPATPQIKDAIDAHLAELERRWGRITACRVVVKGPGQRHRKGGLYEVHIRLALPDGREVNVARTPPADERHSDLTFAVDDAFKHARRQLQDQVRRAQNQIKHHQGPPIATVVRIDPSGEFGFLKTNDGQEVYFHRNSVFGHGASRLRVGSRVTFVEESGEKGPQATTVKLLGKHGLRAAASAKSSA